MVATVGVLLRVEPGAGEAVAREIDLLAAAQPFEVGDAEKLGVLLEVESFESAHRVISERMESIPGVLVAWPVYAQNDPAESPSLEV